MKLPSPVSVPTPPEVPWAHLVPDADWQLYRAALHAMHAAGAPFAVGGGFACSSYARRWRSTKDLDLYILPQDRPALINALRRAGFVDYFDHLPYDRGWIYRGFREGVIVDLIWAMANHYRQTDPAWLERGPLISVHGQVLRLLPVEELIWSKLFVLQRDRCDWPDVLSILYAGLETIDWRHLLKRVAAEAPLLGGPLSVFRWLAPDRARAVPAYVWRRVGVRPPARGSEGPTDLTRAKLLDVRDWFGPAAATGSGEENAKCRSGP